MSISNELAKLLRQAGVDPNLYDTERPGFRKDFKMPVGGPETIKHDFEDPTDVQKKKEKKPKSLDVGPLQNEGSFEDILKKLNVDPNLYRDDHWSKKLPKSTELEPLNRKKKRDDGDTSKPEKKPKALDVGPLEEVQAEYKFRDYDWLKNMAGFNIPSDVYYGTIFLGVIESRPTGYVVLAISGPFHPEIIQQGSGNLFKTKLEAAEIMHKVWARLRKMGVQHPSPKLPKAEEPEK